MQNKEKKNQNKSIINESSLRISYQMKEARYNQQKKIEEISC